MKLLFVYNSNGTVVSLIKDTARKVLSPKTYPCNLCRITYPFAVMEEEWEKFIQSLPHETVFLHRDEFHKKYVQFVATPLPAVFVDDESGIRLLISHEFINRVNNVSELINVIKNSLPTKNIYHCSECGFGYKDRAMAERCRAWCKEHKSCNPEIIQHAVKDVVSEQK